MAISDALSPPPPWLLMFSATDHAQLRAAAKSAAKSLTDGAPPESVAPSLLPADAGGERLAVTAMDTTGLVEGLTAFVADVPSPRWTSGRADSAATRTAWCFGGHGSQWPGMGRALLDMVPVAARILTELDRLLPGGVVEPLRTLADAESGGPETTQPLIFAVQVATARWLESLGLRPAFVVGHSLGEAAAAHVSGALTLAEAAQVVAVRSRLLAQAGGGGAMATVGLDRRTTERRCAEIPGTVVVAAHSAPRETVVTGDGEATRALVGKLEAEGVRCRLIRISAASHSPFVDGVLPRMRAALAGLAPTAPHTPWISTVDPAPDPADLATADYWARNLRQPVRYTQAAAALARRGVRAFVEIGPHPVLTRPTRDTLLAEHVSDPLVTASGHRGTPEPLTVLRLLGALQCRGLDLVAPQGRPDAPGPDREPVSGRG
ncbi:Phthiocerol/phenolphthiocerol synthesis polyketide synthase type I PpsD [Streptomyces leeuwenhoekii]|uniref:Phthiocerol/phenolphthiocerol synthesis polyketide synthase type I PpsD n=2 Tax=Streptomyces leeuwenhoekii TaxID=1437453 RepID=A0A0F7VN37_STRLW|nr:Phthiocerol/phenolphthiocerol synthesis polyketide synthase type I PpsD [Streptomyces leeuwenhoekii]